MKTYRAKKALGQNFLKSESALREIIRAGEIKPNDVILEIGPGKGKLTEKLLQCVYPHPASPYVGGGAKGRGGRIIAVEKDRELFEFLKIKFTEQIENHTLILVCGDILDFQMSEVILSFSNGLAGVGDPEDRGPEKNLKLRNYKIIANIPYNITGAILKKFLTEKLQPELMVLLIQQEVAQRIVAREGKESILSISVKAYGEPKMLMKVPARYFSPAPKVDSAIILIKNISRRIFEENKTRPTEQSFGRVNEDKFWEIVKAGFAHKRKKLSSNLRTVLKNGSQQERFLLNSLGNKRAEDLTLLDWIALAK